MSDEASARSSDLYTKERSSETRTLEPTEAREQPLEVRIEEARMGLERTRGELTELLTPQAGETGPIVLANLLRVCDGVTEGIGAFFKSLFGSPESPINTLDAKSAVLFERLMLQRDHLEELQAIREEIGEVRSRLETLTPGMAADMLAQVQQVREDLTPITELLDRFPWRPLEPGGMPKAPAEVIPGPVHTDTVDRMPYSPVPEVPEVRELIIGDPMGDAAYWHRQNGPTCGVVSQEMILDKVAGDLNAHHEFDLAQEAISNGWCAPDGGSIPAYVGYLLDAKGIHTEIVLREGLSHLIERLGAGQEAIVGVNGQTLWDRATMVESGSDPQPANHALWVTGARVVEHNGVQEVASLFVNDSGDPDGRGREVPVELFLRAWAASGNHTIYATPERS